MATPGLFAGRYRLVRALGIGAQGEVYQAVDLNEGADVAIKVLKPTANASLQWLEAIVLRSLAGHHILPIHNADVVLGQRYLVTALARNGSVDRRITSAGAGLDIDTAVAWTRQACFGVARGHAGGVVHNDVKPGNLFLNDQDECIVGDWGYAGTIDPNTGYAACRGATPTTIAPEVAATWGPGNQSASVASDVYSLGATAFWMLAGTPPVDLSGALDTAAQMAVAATATRTRLRDGAPHVPKLICDRIDQALSMNPDDRFDKPIDFAAALGGRVKVDRCWGRTDEHAGHLGCFRGMPTGNVTAMLVCASPGLGRKVEIRTTYQPSGRAVRASGADSTLAKWVTDVRHIIAALT